MSGIRRRRGFDLQPALAHRGVDCAILCGACHHLIATRRHNMVVFLETNVQRLVEKLPATIEPSAAYPTCSIPGG